GQSGSVTAIFQQNNTASEASSTFNTYVMNDGTTMDWSTLKSDLQPINEPADTWNAIFTNFMALMGTTSGQYQIVLRQKASYLSSQGTYTDDPQTLLSYEVQQADGFGLISQRYSTSAFGRGQQDPYHSTAQTDANGNVMILLGGAQQRLFLRQANGTYAG